MGKPLIIMMMNDDDDDDVTKKPKFVQAAKCAMSHISIKQKCFQSLFEC